MFERFTVAARGVVTRARDEARHLHHPHIGTEHLLLALLSESAGVAGRVLRDAGLDQTRVRADVERLVGTPVGTFGEEDAAALRTIGIDLDAVLARIEETFGPDALQPPPAASRRGPLGRRWGVGTRFTRRAKKTLELALREAIRLGDNAIGAEHILLGLLRDGSGTAAKILADANLSGDDLRRAVLTARSKAA